MDRWDGYAGYDELYHSDYYGMYDYYPEDELYHYGVKGQKWGVRRYQNADGSLTDTGRAHYGRGSGGGRRRAGGYDEKKGVNWRKVAAVGAGVAGAAALGYGAYRFAGTPVGQKYARRISTRAKLAGLKLQRGAERFQPTMEKYGRRVSTRAKLAGLRATNARDMARYNRKLKRVKNLRSRLGL